MRMLWARISLHWRLSERTSAASEGHGHRVELVTRTFTRKDRSNTDVKKEMRLPVQNGLFCDAYSQLS